MSIGRACGLCLTWCIWCGTACGQSFSPQAYLATDSLIAKYTQEENYTTLLPLVEAQLSYLHASGATDSLYRCVYRLGKSLWKVKGAEEAIARSEALVKTIEQQDTNRLHVLQALEDLSWIYYELGRNERCLETDLRYLEICNGMPHAPAKVKSIAAYSVGFDYMSLGNWKAAVKYFDQSIDPLLAEGEHQPGRLVNSYNALGAAHLRMGNFEEARKALKSSLAYIDFFEQEDEQLINRSNVKGNLSLIYESEGDLVMAKDLLHQAIADRKAWLLLSQEPWQKEQQRKLLAANYHNLGAMYFRLGDYTKARQVLEYDRAYRTRILEPGHPDIDKSFETLGSLQIALQQYDSAFINLEKYRLSCLRHYGTNSYFTASAYQRLARLSLEQSKSADALAYYNEAVAIFQAISDEDLGQDLAECYLRRADAHAGLGDRANALNDVDAALRIYMASGHNVDVSKGTAALGKAKILRQFGEAELALESIDKALDYLNRSLNSNSAKSKSSTARLSPLLPDAHYQKALLLLQTLPGSEGTEAALEQLENAIHILRDNKRAFQGDESQLNLYESHSSIFQLAVSLGFEAWSRSNDPAHLNRMFELSEEGRAILLRRQLAGFSSLKVAAVPDSLLNRERQLIHKLAGSSSSPSEEIDFLEEERAYDELQAHLSTRYPAYYKLRYAGEVANIAQMQSRWIPQGATLIRFVLSDSLLFAMVITREGATAIALPSSGLQARIDAFNSAIVRNETVAFRQMAGALYTDYFKPLEPHFAGNTLFIIPDNMLFGLNFEALIEPASGDYLLRKYTISYLHSATTSLQSKSLSGSNFSGALAFAPGFTDEVKQVYRATLPDTALMDDSYLRRIQQPFAVLTAQRVSSLFAGKAYTGVEATEERFKLESGECGIIHLGTHTEINNLSPLLSRLVLTKAHEGLEDGYLHAFEIYNLPLRAELAVLTACETGLGRNWGSEGVLSLAHSFAYAGVPSIVMSLWQIDEKTSSVIVEEFYRQLANGLPKNEALRQAKLHYLDAQHAELQAPYYWSGLVLIGDPGPVANGPAFPWRMVIWWVLAVVIVFGIVVWRKQKLRQGKLRV